jgi:shikimate kinase
VLPADAHIGVEDEDRTVDFSAGPVIKALALWVGAAIAITLVTLLVVSLAVTGGLTFVKRLVSGGAEPGDREDEG